MRYKEWMFSNPGDGRKLTYAVHGWDNSYNCYTGYQIMCPYGACTGEQAHMTVPYFVDLVDDVMQWLGDSPYASPPPLPPSPSPPPFPPLGTWFTPPPNEDGVV